MKINNIEINRNASLQIMVLYLAEECRCKSLKEFRIGIKQGTASFRADLCAGEAPLFVENILGGAA